eukprot:TRINITY_DN43776_c0_g1_i1.p1 TRINITY_DN43776_c0_g1~~TRINITY_DN43776_c0_g1_i1.p1  ORF type:complete len:487 (+),score=33.81 TRINITY_DN43776_c0_g1_i1:39-1463(+)
MAQSPHKGTWWCCKRKRDYSMGQIHVPAGLRGVSDEVLGGGVIPFLGLKEVFGLRRVSRRLCRIVEEQVEKLVIEGRPSCCKIKHLNIRRIGFVGCCKQLLGILRETDLHHKIKCLSGSELDQIPKDMPLQELEVTRFKLNPHSKYEFASSIRKLTLDLPPHAHEDTEQICHQWLYRATASLTNLTELKLSSHCGTLCASILQTVSRHGKTLTSCELDFPSSPDPDLSILIGQTPLLTSLKISTAISPSLPSVISLLENCPKLESAKLHFPGLGVGPCCGVGSGLKFPALRRLSVWFPKGTEPWWLGVGDLEELEIHGGHQWGVGENCVQKLTVRCLCSHKAWADMWGYIAQCCPNLTCVKATINTAIIADPSVFPQTLKRLQITPHPTPTPCMLPLLHRACLPPTPAIYFPAPIFTLVSATPLSSQPGIPGLHAAVISSAHHKQLLIDVVTTSVPDIIRSDCDKLRRLLRGCC